MTTTQEALKMAIEALQNNQVYDCEGKPMLAIEEANEKAIQACKEALEQGDRVYTNTNHGFNLKDRHFYVNANESIADENFDFDATLFVQGDFGNVDDKKQYAQMICNALNAQREALEQANKEGIVIGGWKLTYAGDEWVSREVYENLKRKVEALEQQEQEHVAFDMQTICNKYGIELRYIDEVNTAWSANDIIAIGKFDDKDLETVAFFHELGHCIFKPVNNQWMDTLSMEGTAWEIGRKEAQKYGFNWKYKSKELQWARKELNTYTHPAKQLSDDEIIKLAEKYLYDRKYNDVTIFARAIEAKIRGE